MRDTLYERELLRNAKRMASILDDFRKRGQLLSETDQLAVQRALQILVESVIGMSRYVAEAVLDVRVGKSREGLDELRRAQLLDPQTHTRLMKIVGFRNVLVHDYLNIEDNVVQALVDKGEYDFLPTVLTNLIGIMDKGVGKPQ
jgi:uncharacterized protein YutE (UPF0331/DUF86 family)